MATHRLRKGMVNLNPPEPKRKKKKEKKFTRYYWQCPNCGYHNLIGINRIYTSCNFNKNENG